MSEPYDLSPLGWTLRGDESVAAAEWTREGGAIPVIGGRVRIWSKEVSFAGEDLHLAITLMRVPKEAHYHALWGILPWSNRPRAVPGCFAEEKDAAHAALQSILDALADFGAQVSALKAALDPCTPVFSMRKGSSTIQ